MTAPGILALEGEEEVNWCGGCRKLGVIVGAAILLTNARTLMTTFGIGGLARSAMYLGIVVVVGAVAAWRLSQARSRRRARQPVGAPILPEPVAELVG
jgi:hypothetical protein